MQKKIPIISFFSGGGFMDSGFEQAGFEIAWSNEFDLAFARMNREGNRLEKIINTKSILDLKSEDILSEAFPSGKAKIFGVIGGPPCQDFSMKGKKQGFSGERGKLTIVYFNKILELKPNFFVMENVSGLMRKKETKDYFMKLLKKVEKYYDINIEKLNALDFGVPQFRERIFIVGFRKNFKHGEFLFPKKKDVKNKYEWGKLNNTIAKFCVESYLVPDDKLDKVPNANEIFKVKVS
jgi:DNA (cytosine-5)-methyltransferase 1